jgi:hypothetical protein
LFELEPGRAFSPRVRYVYEKQLEEADLIVVNKIDLVDAVRLERLVGELSARFPAGEVLAVSARDRSTLAPWFSRIFDSELGIGPSPDVDYDVYADGEARLGWFNGTIRVTSDAAIDGNRLLETFAAALRNRLAAQNVEIAHCKMTLTADEMADDMAALNLVRSDAVPEFSHRLRDAIAGGELLLNLRAEAAPDTLQGAVDAALAECSAGPDAPRLQIVHAEAFSPPRPTPTHRMATA